MCMLCAIRNPMTSALGPGCGYKTVGTPAYNKSKTEKTHGRNRQHNHGQRAQPRDHQGGAQGHFRLVPGHRVRMVRLLSLRLSCRDYRQALLCWRQRDNVLHLCLARVRRRLRRSPLRRHRVRPSGRHDRAQAHLPDHHCDHGYLYRRRGLFARLRDHWRGGTDHPDHPAPVARPGPGWRVWRRSDLRGRTCTQRQAWLLHLVDTDHRHPRPVPFAPGDPGLPYSPRQRSI